jgi:uncharacterized protein involved in response to NO
MTQFTIASIKPLSSESRTNKNYSVRNVLREPFRLFFPAATLAGIVGVALWPLHLLGLTPIYPGQFHARIMAHGLFGGFIFGFLATAMPRMLSARPLRGSETIGLLSLHVMMVAAYAVGNSQVGNSLFFLLLAGFVGFMATRVRERKDLPPPGFVLVAFSFLCAGAGALLGIFEGDETSMFRITLQHLLTYQGFVLFPILGIGPFILPRFFGMTSAHDFPESLTPTRPWSVKALTALFAGILILATFILEAKGAVQLAYAFRFIACLSYLLREFPLKTAPKTGSVFGAGIRIALLGILSGFLTIAFFPAYRVGLLHLTLIGGFAVVTFVVATRVLFGHSGNLDKLKGKNRWFLVSLGSMLFAMATRISGDFWSKIMASHYIYGAILWIIGVLIWAIYALPKTLMVDEEA